MPSVAMYPKWIFPSGFPTTIAYAFIISPLHATCHTHKIFLSQNELYDHGEPNTTDDSSVLET
jgi:hypothetical protein